MQFQKITHGGGYIGYWPASRVPCRICWKVTADPEGLFSHLCEIQVGMERESQCGRAVDCTGYDSMSTCHQIESPTNGNFPRATKFSVQQVASIHSVQSYAFKVCVRGLLPWLKALIIGHRYPCSYAHLGCKQKLSKNDRQHDYLFHGLEQDFYHPGECNLWQSLKALKAHI